MKKGFLRCIAVVMVVIMAAVCVPVMEFDSVFNIEASALTSNNNAMGSSSAKWSYDTSNKTLTISGSGAMPNYTNTPDAFADYNWRLVVTIMNNANKIVINNGITSIGNNVFKGFKNVSSVTIPSSVTSIGTSAFEGCSSLATVSLPSGLKSIGANAFKGTKVSKITIPAAVTSIGAGAFSGISGLKVTCSYGSEAYNYCLKNSISCALTENILVNNVSVDTAKKQVSVVLKIAYNKANFNAGNFTLTYNNAVKPVSTETVYKTANDVSTAVVYNGTGKISVAVMAQDFVPYSSNTGICEYTLAELKFNINGQADKAEFSFNADTLMFNNAKTSIKSTSKSADLHVYTETVKKEPTCSVAGIKVTSCSVCGKKTETQIPVNSAKHGSTQLKNKVDATCNKAGYTGDKACKDCGVVISAGSAVPATGKHDYKTVVTKATCLNGGFTTYSCKNCSDSYKGNFTKALGHNFDASGKCTRCSEVTVVSVTFKDNTGISVDNETKVIIISKTLKAEELGANITSGNWAVTDAKGNALEDGTAVATGNLIKATTADVTYSVIILGDVNSDGKVNAADARLILRVASRIETADELFALAADCDGKAKVTASDARIVLRVASRLQTF